MMRAVHEGLAMKIDTLAETAIPVMRQTIALWLSNARGLEAAKAAEAADESVNEALQRYGENFGKVLPDMERRVQTPTFSPESVRALALGVKTASLGIQSAITYGRQVRSELATSINEAQAVIADADQALKDTFISQYVENTKKAEADVLEQTKYTPAP
jgi:uncharacterized protein YaaN involved in tellurite resistance